MDSNGEYRSHDFIGFATVGSGSRMAFPEMSKYLYSPSLTMNEVLARVYNAKKSVERVQGVGQFTDLFVLHVIINQKQERTIQLWVPPKDVQNILEGGRDEIQKKEAETYKGIFEKLVTHFKKEEEKNAKKTEEAKPSEGKKTEKV